MAFVQLAGQGCQIAVEAILVLVCGLRLAAEDRRMLLRPSAVVAGGSLDDPARRVISARKI
jgi:hypothetical protein